MQNSPRYTIDCVGELEWSLFDERRRGQPRNYFMYVVPVVNGPFNYQLVLTVFNAVTSAEFQVPVFEAELYSTFFYSEASAVEDFVLSVYEELLDCEIDNPYGLTHEFGGTVNNQVGRMYPWYRPH